MQGKYFKIVLTRQSSTVTTEAGMELSQLVKACEETSGGEAEVSALVSYCETRLGWKYERDF